MCFIRGFFSTAGKMSHNSNGDADHTNGVRNALVNLSLMRSINMLKDHISLGMDQIREISGVVASAREDCEKADLALQNLADSMAGIMEELNKVSAEHDVRREGDVIAHGDSESDAEEHSDDNNDNQDQNQNQDQVQDLGNVGLVNGIDH